jgi:hypothetical protein
MNTHEITRLFPSQQFDSILLISDTEQADTGHVQGVTSYTLEQALDPERLSGKWDLLIIQFADIHPEQPEIQQLIGRCRDILARRLAILLEEAPSAKVRQQLIGLGLHQLPGYAGVFYHDLYDYKPTPDWLNNRFWANPELWNKYRW